MILIIPAVPSPVPCTHACMNTCMNAAIPVCLRVCFDHARACSPAAGRGSTHRSSSMLLRPDVMGRCMLKKCA